MTNTETNAADPVLDEAFASLGALLSGFADLGEGTVIGLVPPGRAGVRRVSRAQAAEVMHLSDGAVKRYTADGVRRLRERLTA